jgi:F0F1-type ATP synthase assembly protein I
MADDAPHRSDDNEPDLDAIEKAAQEAADRLLGVEDRIGGAVRGASEAAELDDGFDARLKEIEERADHHRVRSQAAKAKAAREDRQNADSARGLGVGMTIAYAILGMPLLGAGLGWLLDERLGGKLWIGVGMLLGAAAGIGFAVLTLNRVNKEP